MRRVLGIGLPKTGTTSLGAALEILGYRHVRYPLTREELRRHEAATDVPVCAWWRELHREFPDAMFILTTRDRESWLQSCRRHWSRPVHPRKRRSAYRFRREVFGIAEFDAARFEEVYHRHHDEVRESILNVACLDVSAGDGWPELCGMLDRPVPTIPFPHLNQSAGPTSADKYRELGNDYHWQKARDSRSAYRRQVRRVLQHFPTQGRGATLLDAGCGDGWPASRLVRRGYRVHGVDELTGPLAVARGRVAGGTFSQTWPTHAFDYVLAMESLEHMLDPAPLVRAVRGCRQYALVTVPPAGSDPWAVADIHIDVLFHGCRIVLLDENARSRIYRIEP